MQLNVKVLDKEITIVDFPQTEAALTKSFPVGSSSFSGCLGLCIWNRRGKVGIVAHVENRGTDYPTAFKDVCDLLKTKMDNNGGNKGALSMVIFGANSTDNYSDSFKNSISNVFGSKLIQPLRIMDIRNGNINNRIGKVTPISDGVFYGAGILDPGEETLYLMNSVNFSKSVKTKKNGKKVELFKIQ